MNLPTQLRCLVVDDDPLAIQVVQNCISNTPFLSFVGSCENAVLAAQALSSNTIDILYLDVEMPLMSGLDLLRSLLHRPQVVLITSNPTYALEAFEYDVVDFLVKPVTYARFLKASQKAREMWEAFQLGLASSDSDDDEMEGIPAPGADFTFLKVENRLIKIHFVDVLYIEALGDYIHVVTDTRKHIVYASLKAVVSRFPEHRFLRIHRSFFVNIGRIDAIEDNNIIIGDRILPIGQTFLKDVFQRINRY
jgi:two-component system, LytTR family, response regulator